MNTSSPPPDPIAGAPRRPLSFLAAACWSVLSTILVSLCVQVTEAARPGAINDLVNITACYVLSYSIVILVMLRVYEPGTRVREVLAVRSTSPGAHLLAAVVGAGIAPVLSALDDVLAARFPSSPEELESVDALMNASTQGKRLLLVTTFVLILPVCEELFFRGVLFGGLRRARRPEAAILASAVFFAAALFDARAFLPALLLGLVLGWIRSTTGSMVAAIAAHVTFVAVQLVPALWTPAILRGAAVGDVVYPRSWLGIGVAIAAASAALLAATTARSSIAKEARFADR